MMKKIELMPCRAYSILSICLMMVIAGCKKQASTPTIPFQGPKNPSFETSANVWFVTYTLSNGPGQGASMADILTGTGFMPTDGIKYANLTTYNVSYHAAPEATMYQDGVDFTHSTSLTFDYSFTGTLGPSGGTATAQILFTSNGTVTLWTKTVDNTVILPVQKLNETIALPPTTSPGRLTITIDATGGVNNNTITQTRISFGLDNFRVH
jgi:hypothetical protein